MPWILTLYSGDDFESDCSQNTDVAILENSTKSEGKAWHNNTIVLQKAGELIANLHILLVKKALKRICKGAIMDTQDVSVVGLLISRPTGIVFCKYIIPFTNVVPTLIVPARAKLKCLHINSLFIEVYQLH